MLGLDRPYMGAKVKKFEEEAMLQNLTQVADYKGVRFVRDEKLTGRKYAVKYKDGDEVYVSPAVYELLQTDLDSVAQTLRVKELPGRSRRGRG